MYNTYVYESIAAQRLEESRAAAAANHVRGQVKPRRRRGANRARQLIRLPSMTHGGKPA